MNITIQGVDITLTPFFMKQTYDDFLAKYTRKENHLDPDAGWDGCLFETFDIEVEHVCEVANNPSTANTVWTLVEGDHETLHLIAGYHLVNRQGYFITTEPWGDEGESYEVWGEEDWEEIREQDPEWARVNDEWIYLPDLEIGGEG